MSEARRLVLLGGGGHAAVVAESARAAGWIVAHCLDDVPAIADSAGRVGLALLGGLDDLERIVRRFDRPTVHAAVGDNALRREWLGRAEALGAVMAAISHPSAELSASAVIGEGVFMGPRAVVNARARLGAGVIINTAGVVEHDCRIDAFAHVAPGAVLCGGASVGEQTLIGAGATVCPGVRIGGCSVLGAGAVATTDIPDRCRAVGAPARPVTSISGEDGQALRR